MPNGYLDNLTSEDKFFRLAPGFEVTMKGLVRRVHGDKRILPVVMIDGLPCVETGNYWRLARSPAAGYNTVSDMVALNFKPQHLPVSLLRKLGAYPKDGDEFNHHPSNLLWRFTEPLEVPWLDNFFYIPGYTKHAINKDTLEILRVEDCSSKNQTLSDRSGYIYCNVPNDIPGKRGLTYRYEASALAFLETPLDHDLKAINHKDGVRDNDRHGNLEWLFHEENVRHALVRKQLNIAVPPDFTYRRDCFNAAKIEDLYKRSGFAASALVLSVPVRPTVVESTPDLEASKRKVKNAKRAINRLDIHTNEMVSFESISIAARVSDLLTNQIYQSINSDIFGEEGFGLVNGKWIFRYDNMGFPEITPLSKIEMLRSGGTRRPVQLLNKSTNRVMEFVSVREASRELGIIHNAIFNALGDGTQLVSGTHWLVRFKDSTTDWKL